MKVAELAKEINALSVTGRVDAETLDVTHDSRASAPGTVFVAVRGEKIDAHKFIPQAAALGATAIISERDSEKSEAVPAWIKVSNARAALAQASAAVHGHPSKKLKLVGITGTNGKTTTAHLIDSIIRAVEGTSAMFGTINHYIGNESITAKHTTPEAPDIQRMLARALVVGCRSAVMEVSSHSIELHRADALSFAVAAFTNLTRDHLDYHQNMESYFNAKKRLFDGSLGAAPASSVINIDDQYGRRLMEEAPGEKISYGFAENSDVRTNKFRLSAKGTEFTAITPEGEIGIRSSLVGRPHVYNILAAIASGLALGFDPEGIANGIALCRSVAGRFEQVVFEGKHQPDFTVVVDYAHTDDALKNVLQTAREVAQTGRLITVFGCGGDRDRTKRAPMGEIASSLSDIAIATSDNPRTESPEAIIADIEVGLRRVEKPYLKITDRREAIFRAIEEARDGDIVVIAGKGHETYQILGDQTIHFDDREVVREALSGRVD